MFIQSLILLSKQNEILMVFHNEVFQFEFKHETQKRLKSFSNFEIYLGRTEL